MRISRHLSCISTCRSSFVQRLPTDPQAVLDCRLIKRTRRTKALSVARLCAVLLSCGYARLFAQLRDQRVGKLAKLVAELPIARLTMLSMMSGRCFRFDGVGLIIAAASATSAIGCVSVPEAMSQASGLHGTGTAEFDRSSRDRKRTEGLSQPGRGS
ncbi:hypothetical protein ABIA71_001341 [Stenotrophomonas sp. 2619]|uniref:hypothetical protein n=1 Tax=Stenotrophomonas sp. 2619 TaxID=3156316 RepID=UPI003395BA28